MFILKKIRNLILENWTRFGRRLVNDHYIFVHKNEEKLQFEKLAGEQIFSFTSFDDLPEETLKQITLILGQRYEQTLKKLFSQRAKLYILLLDGEFGSMGWIQSARNLTRWWTELETNDFVMFSAITNPHLRGRHLWGRILAESYLAEKKLGGRYYCDCSVANIPSQKQLERAGFEIIGRESQLRNFAK